MTRVYGNKVTNTSSGSTRTWRLYADYSVSSTETSYTIKGTSLGVQNTASSSATTMGFNANSLTVSYSGVLTASYKRTTKTGEIKGGATFEFYGTDKSAVIERTRVAQTKSLTCKGVANSNTAWEGTSTKTVSFTIPARSSHTVSYDANGGSGSIEPFTKFYSATGETAYYETLSDGSGFSKANYRITGWNTMPDGSGTSYPLSGDYTANGTTAVTLYAQWKTTYVKPEIQNLLAFRTANASGGASPTVTSTGTTGFCKFTLVGGANYTFTSATVQFGTAAAKSMTKSGSTVYGYSTVGSIAQASAYTVKVTVVVKGTDGVSRTYTDSTFISKSVPVFDAANDGNCFAFFGTATDGLTSPKLLINGELALGTALSIANGGTGAKTAAAARSNLGINASNLGIKDYVVEQGKSGIWTYEKWNSGTIKCWTTNYWTTPTLTMSAISSSGTYKSNTLSMPFPTDLFTDITNCFNVRFGFMSGGTYLLSVMNSAPSNSVLPVVIVKGGSSTSACSIYAHAVGRWK